MVHDPDEIGKVPREEVVFWMKSLRCNLVSHSPTSPLMIWELPGGRVVTISYLDMNQASWEEMRAAIQALIHVPDPDA